MAEERQVKSCGYILLHRGEEGVEALVMVHARRFDLPKGHTEEGETEEETGAREVMEETSLDVHSMERVEGFRFEDSYRTRYKRFGGAWVTKTLVLFAAFVDDAQAEGVVVTEHADAAWVPFPAPGKTITTMGGERKGYKPNKSMQKGFAALHAALASHPDHAALVPPVAPGNGTNKKKRNRGRGRNRDRGRNGAGGDGGEEGEHTSHPLVVNVRTANDVYDVYIGRANPRIRGGSDPKWGNPFRIGGPENLSRDDVVRLHKEYIDDRIRQDPAFLDQIQSELGGKVLACWCAPKSCHGLYLAQLANPSSP